jgi:hypothetical protein
MKDSKPWYQSKGVLLGIVTFVIGSLEIVRSLLESGDFSAIALVMAAGGIMKVSERVFSKGEEITF